MKHIELLGPPGVGKSTIFHHLARSPSFFGEEEEVIRRTVLQNTKLLNPTSYNIASSVTNGRIVSEFLKYRLQYNAFESFIIDNPGFLNAVSVAIEKASYESEKIFSFCKGSAERYQMAITSVQDDEFLCLDRGLIQRAVFILWRCIDSSYNLSNYFNSIPIPDLVVHLNAPAHICLERQNQRGRSVVSKDWESDNVMAVQQKLINACFEISNYLQSLCRVIVIDNTGSVTDTVNKIKSEVCNL